MQVVVFCDVSGLMIVYVCVFLVFFKGMVVSYIKIDVYLFYICLICVIDVFIDNDILCVVVWLLLMVEGFGGGIDIVGSLNQFLNGYGVWVLNGCIIVVILFDGYCIIDVVVFGDVLVKFKCKICRIVWLNLLVGWDSYEFVVVVICVVCLYIDVYLFVNILVDLVVFEL